jgi:hypothetical protein
MTKYSPKLKREIVNKYLNDNLDVNCFLKNILFKTGKSEDGKVHSQRKINIEPFLGN